MTDGYMRDDGVESKLARIEERRALGEAQGDFEDGAHLGAHPDNVDRAAKAEREAKERLASSVARIERLTEEKAAIQSDISDLFKELKSSGHHIKAVKAVIKRRAMDPDEADELDNMVSFYRSKLEG